VNGGFMGEMKMVIGVVFLLALVIVAFNIGASSLGLFGYSQKQSIKIGVVTDLSGSASYWGESTRAGAELAKKELIREGYDVELIFEDYRLDSKTAVSATQKLINLDDVDFIYFEFSPGAFAVSSVISDTGVPQMYAAVPISLLEKEYNFKTYVNYKPGCESIAKLFKEQGITKIGVLKAQSEFGELCLEGVKDIFPDAVVQEFLPFGQEKDLRTQISKLKEAGASAVINSGIEPDSLLALKQIKELGWIVRYGATVDGITDRVLLEFPGELKGALQFKLKEPSPEFKSRVDSIIGRKASNYYGAALAYLHFPQIIKAISSCPKKDLNCITKKINSSQADEFLGFKGFKNKEAMFDLVIEEIN
jgi:ABC-type branched-subunit amino acid transport system substrate-binding protein